MVEISTEVLFDGAAPVRGGAADRPAPRATSTGAGRLRRRRSCPRVVLISSDATAVRRHLSGRGGAGEDVLVITGTDSLARLDGVRLGRRDRVEYLEGWSSGPQGRELALAVERAAAVGLFGRARHAFAVDG